MGAGFHSAQNHNRCIDDDNDYKSLPKIIVTL